MSGRFRTGLLISSIVAGWACSSAVPTDVEEIRAVGEHVLVYGGADLEVVLGTGYAVGHVGEEYLLLGATFAGVDSNGMTTIDRSKISVRTPDRRMIPLMSQSEFRDAYANLVVPARRAEVYSPTALESRPLRRPCNDWFFRPPTDGLARDVLTISSVEVCDGILFFHVPGGVSSGAWALEIELRERVVEIPFVLD